MDSFEIIVAPKALAQLESYIDYIQYTLLNEQAADSVWRDALETIDALATCAGSLALCTHPALNRLGYRAMFFISHRYVMLYRISGKTVYVDGIYHTLQDYENIFFNN